MAKSRHSRKSAAAKRYRDARRPVAAPAEAATPAPPAPPRAAEAVKAAAPAAKVSATSKVVDLVNEYRYVLGDLKRLGILAAAMFALLVVLALVVR